MKKITKAVVLLFGVILFFILSSCSKNSNTNSINSSTTTDTSHVHIYGSWEIVTDSTTTTTGIKQRTCSICGYVENEVIEKKALLI